MVSEIDSLRASVAELCDRMWLTYVQSQWRHDVMHWPTEKGDVWIIRLCYQGQGMAEPRRILRVPFGAGDEDGLRTLQALYKVLWDSYIPNPNPDPIGVQKLLRKSQIASELYSA